MAASWKRIEAWLGQHMSDSVDDLARGATAAQIAKVEKKLGITLPEEYRQSCVIHDGPSDDFDLIPIGFGTYYLLRLRDIADEWSLWSDLHDGGEFEGNVAEPGPGVAGDWWNPGWIPFAANGGGDHLCLDLVPAPDGTVGQVIIVEHDSAARTVLASSFAAWLAWLADALEAGELDDFFDE